MPRPASFVTLIALSSTLIACGHDLPLDPLAELGGGAIETDRPAPVIPVEELCMPGVPLIDDVRITRQGEPGTALYIEVSGQTCEGVVESFDWYLYDADNTQRQPRAPSTELVEHVEADGRFTLRGYTRASCGDFRGDWLQVEVITGDARSRPIAVALPGG